MENTYEKITEKELKKKGLSLLNVLNLILHKGWYCCFCEKFDDSELVNDRILCYLPDFEKDLHGNQFDHQFLISYNLRLVDYLWKIFHLNKSLIEFFFK